MVIDNYYFNLNINNFYNVITKIQKRKKRSFLVRLFLNVTRGDILAVVFRVKSLVYRFEGICMGFKNKKLLNPNTSFLLRNILFGVGVEFTFSYYYNRSYGLSISDYKRKQFDYKRSKLYFLRDKLNRASRVL